MLDHALVLGRASGLRAGVGDQRAVLGDARVLLETDRVLVKRARGEIMVNFGHGQTVTSEIKCWEVVLFIPYQPPIQQRIPLPANQTKG